MSEKIYDVIIIGAGAAGLMCAASPAWEAASFSDAEKGGRLLLEGGDRAGIKLLLSGGGHCNITHEGQMRDLFPAYGKAAKKLRGPLTKYSNKDSMAFLERSGVALYADESGRVFPKSMEAGDILDAYRSAACRNGFDIAFGRKVSGISPDAVETEQERIYSVQAGEETYLCRKLIIAAGGRSYPKTGSDGSMFGVLERDLGTRITETKPALAPVITEEYPYADLAGITLPHVRISIHRDGEKSVHREGPVLFTHSSFSGPCALDISGSAPEGSRMAISYISPVTYEEAYAKINELDIKSGKSAAREFSLPKRLADILIERAGGSPKRLAHLLTEDMFIVKGTEGYEKAMVTKGGVMLEQIDASKMQLKDHPGIYVIGEMIDADGYSGGYNLQLCWSTAQAAAYSAAKELKGGEV